MRTQIDCRRDRGRVIDGAFKYLLVIATVRTLRRRALSSPFSNSFSGRSRRKETLIPLRAKTVQSLLTSAPTFLNGLLDHKVNQQLNSKFAL
jgi:hypothetical protein